MEVAQQLKSVRGPSRSVGTLLAPFAEEVIMETSELVQAAATIASGMVASQEARRQLDQESMNRIAEISVEMARRIEDEVRKAYG